MANKHLNELSTIIIAAERDHGGAPAGRGRPASVPYADPHGAGRARDFAKTAVERFAAWNKARTDETESHIGRVGLYAEAIARKAGGNGRYAKMLRLAAAIHDLGKITIPDSILRKPATLTEGEWKIMQTHTTRGADMLRDTRIPALDMARSIAMSHHEKCDGSGYPYGLPQKHIPNAARIVAIADVYDALVSDRVYREALPETEALGMMAEGRGTHFDPQFFELFVRLLPDVRRRA